MMSDNSAQISAFLEKAGWGAATRKPLTGDASSRRYEKLELSGKKAVLMDASKGVAMPPEPDGATAKYRAKLGYNSLVRLGGAKPEVFACLANELKMRGFSAPTILAIDHEDSLMLSEDFGDGLYANVIADEPAKEGPLYKAAIDTLAAIYRSSFPVKMQALGKTWHVRDYDAPALQAEADLFLDWFAADFGHDIQDKARDDWYGIWKKLWPLLDAHPNGLALRDFHAENLFWLPKRQSVARVGLIDFQDGLFAHPAYDLVSLLEDARRDVSLELHVPLMKRFCDKAGLAFDDNFKAAYAVMGAQRNAKILGIFVRLAKRDGKPQYRDLIPRVAAHFLRDIDHPALAELKTWLETHVPEIFTRFPIVKTAMVMAAGHGTRMRPLTDDRSKAMVDVDGRALIDHTLDRLAQAGVEKAVVNVHAHADHLETHLSHRKNAPEIILSDERQELLETGGGLVKALPLLGNDPIFICNIDAIWQENSPVLQAMLQMWDSAKMDDLLLLAPIEETLGYAGKGDFSFGGDGRIARREGDSAPYVYAGVQIARLGPAKAFKVEPFSRNKMWDVSLSKGRAFGVVLDGFWMHVGDPAARDEAEARLGISLKAHAG